MSTIMTTVEKTQAAIGLLEQGNFDAALELFTEVTTEDPKAIDGYIGLGKIYLERGDYSAAEKAFTAARNVDPEEGVVYFHIANLRMVQLRFSEAEDNYLKAIRKGCKNARLYYNFGRYYFRFRKYREAIDCFRDGLEIEPANIKLLSGLCDAYLQLNDFDSARRHASVLSITYPRRSETFFWNCEVVRRSEGNEAALDYLDEEIQENPGIINLRYNRARTLVRLNRFDEALAELDNIEAMNETYAYNHDLTYDAANPQSWLIDPHSIVQQRAQIYGLTGQVPEMEEALLEAREIRSKQDPELIDTVSNHALVLLRTNQGDFEGSLELLEEILRAPLADPFRRAAGYTMGKCLAELGREEEAEEYFEQAVQDLEPMMTHDNILTDVPIVLAYCYCELGDYEKALARADRALELLPENPDANGVKGLILEKMGEAEKAAEFMKKSNENTKRLIELFEDAR